MWRFLKRKHAEKSEEVIDEKPQGHEEPQTLTNSAALVVQQRAKVDPSLRWLLINWLTWTGDPGFSISLCNVCGKRLSNAVMATAKVKTHFAINNSHMKNKGAN